MQILPDGAYAISDVMSIPGEGRSMFVFCAGWLLEIVEIDHGEFYFFRDGEEIRPRSPRRFGIFYPPFSVIHSFVNNIKGRVNGVGTIEPLPGLPTTPLIFETDFDEPFTSAGQAIELLNTCSHRQSIEINSKPSLLSLRAKKLIDENYLVFPSIARIASRIGVSHAHLSRQFKHDYLMSPSNYLHKLRVAEATHRLSLGEEIIEISADVGYNDLSRFYKQFRKATQTSPALCRNILESGGKRN